MKYALKTRLSLSRLLVLFLSVAVLLSGMALPAAAEDDEELDPRFASWRYDAATDFVFASFPANHEQKEPSQKVYGKYTGQYAERMFTLATTRIFEYENSLWLPTGMEVNIFAPDYAAEILMLQDEAGHLVMLFTEAGVREIEAMLSMSEYTTYRVVYHDQGHVKLNTVDVDLGRDITALSDTAHGETMRLSELKYATGYQLIGYAENPHVGAELGILFDLGDTLGYLDTRTLPTTCFDENGELDRASDYEVTLHPLTFDQTEDMRNDIRYASLNFPLRTEESDITPESPDTIIAFTVMGGILLPIAPVAVGLTKARSKKARGTNRWYLLAAMGGVWMLCGVIVLISMICVLF